MNCGAAVRKRIQGFEGVQDFKVDTGKWVATVTFKEAGQTEKFVKYFNDLGRYSVAEAKEEKTN